MKCAQARRLFGAYWDDDTTLAEREWLEAHLASCQACAREYEDLARVLELTSSLPRVEPAPDLVERTLAQARRATTVADRVPTAPVAWVPVTAAAVALLLMGAALSTWLGMGVRERAPQMAERPAVTQPVLVKPVSQPVATAPASEALASIPDTLFDHSEDVEFILDPVTLKRGRATVTRTLESPRAEQAIITF
jgi:predicted anti-sigma-YlaC factor YlaD